MREPVCTSTRPIIVRVLLIAFVLVLSACGNTGGGPSGPPAESASAAKVGACAPGDAELTSATQIGVADLGLGEAPVALTAAGGQCPDTIFTQAPEGTAHARLRYPPADARLIRVGDASVVAVRQDHARGGFQEHLYAVRGTELREVTRNGNPLLPFVALDVAGEPHASADCGSDGLRVLEAAATEPPGVLMAWDVFTTTYTFPGGDVRASPRQRIAHSVPDGNLETAHPQLFNDRWFTHCR